MVDRFFGREGNGWNVRRWWILLFVVRMAYFQKMMENQAYRLVMDCPDKRGVVARVSSRIAELGGTIRMYTSIPIRTCRQICEGKEGCTIERHWQKACVCISMDAFLFSGIRPWCFRIDDLLPKGFEVAPNG